MKHVFSKKKFTGFTIIEMTLAVTLTMGIAAALIGLINQQVNFTTIMQNYRFLREDAPQINTLLTNIINKSDSYRIYPDLSKALSQTGAVRTDGRVLRLRFRNPDGTTDHAMIAFENTASGRNLNYYFRAYDAAAWSNTPSWTISSRPDVVSFDNSSGILVVELVGPQGEEIAYAGNPD